VFLLARFVSFYWLALAFYLAFKIATAAGLTDQDPGTPLSFVQGIGIQAVNVKMMGVAASVFATYPVSENLSLNVMVIALTAVCLNGPCLSVWGVFGLTIRRFLSNQWSLRLFNLVLATLIIISLIPIILELMAIFGFFV